MNDMRPYIIATFGIMAIEIVDYIESLPEDVKGLIYIVGSWVLTMAILLPLIIWVTRDW